MFAVLDLVKHKSRVLAAAKGGLLEVSGSSTLYQHVSIYRNILTFPDHHQPSGRRGGDWGNKKKPEVLLSLCVRPLFCMHPKVLQTWTAPHSHAAVAPKPL